MRSRTRARWSCAAAAPSGHAQACSAARRKAPAVAPGPNIAARKAASRSGEAATAGSSGQGRATMSASTCDPSGRTRMRPGPESAHPSAPSLSFDFPPTVHRSTARSRSGSAGTRSKSTQAHCENAKLSTAWRVTRPGRISRGAPPPQAAADRLPTKVAAVRAGARTELQPGDQMTTVSHRPMLREATMKRSSSHKLTVAMATAAAFLLTASVPAFAEDKTEAQQDSTTQPAEKHHSKAKGAVVGGVGGAVVGGKKGAAVGAAGGALLQHHKNKKAMKKQEKAQKQQ